MPVSSQEQQYAANPQKTNLVASNYLYPDGSMFAFDGEPRYVCNDWTDIRINGVYDVPKGQRMARSYAYNGWTNWVDKFQKDYRFSSQSDTNARATLFPEVHDPWMYTEYLYEGTGAINDLYTPDTDGNPVAPPAAPEGIVEPPLVEPTRVTRTIAEDGTVTASQISTVNDQPATVVNDELQTIYQLENKWKSDVAPFKEYWQSELEAMGWSEDLDAGATNVHFTRLNVQRRVVKYAVPVLNSGVRLYNHSVWAQATRWGESQNIPPRVVNLTGPRDYFKPDGIFTGRIVPHVKVEWGIPIYDCLQSPQAGQQAYIRYQNPGSTASERIFLWPVVPAGPTGDPRGDFLYATPPNDDNFTGALEVPNMPRKNVVSLIQWNPENYANNDLVHRGCQFWVGHAGTTKCQYFADNASQFNSNYEDTHTYSDPTAVLGDLLVAPFFESDDEVMVFVYNDSLRPTNLTSAGFTITNLHGTSGAVTSIRIGPGTIHPAATDGSGFYDLAAGAVRLHVVVRKKGLPYPDPAKCAMYDGPTQASPDVDPKQRYLAAGGKCKYYTPVGPQVVHSYQATAANGAEWANLQRGLPPGYKKSPSETAYGQTMMAVAQLGPIGLGLPAAMGYAFALNAMSPDPFTKGITKYDNSRVTVEYVPEEIPLDGKTTYYDTPDRLPRGQTPAADVRVDPATGFYTFDDQDVTPLGGVDSTFFGSVNQQNFRVMHNVMHCYRADKCNPIISSPTGNVGWRRGRFSDINFTTHPLHISGWPAYDGSDKFCHTGDRRCPHNRMDRRAHEYNENYKVLRNEVLKPFRLGGVDAFSGFGIREAFVVNGKVKFLVQQGFFSQGMCVGVRLEQGNPPVVGHYAPLVLGDDGLQYRIYFYYDRPSWDPLHRRSRVSAHIVQFSNGNDAQYMTAPAGRQADWTTLYGDATKVPWLVELFDDYQEPSGNLVHCTNSKAFSGGRAPEYKDRSKIGDQILCKTAGYSDLSFMTGATLSNQFGGPPSNTAPVAGQVRQGYWTQREGEWILDGRPVGFGEGFVPNTSRQRNKPVVYGKRTPIDGNPSVSFEDPSDPKKNRGSDYANTAWSYSNDTAAYLTHLRAGAWEADLPLDPFSGETVNIRPPSANPQFLPRERLWYRCDKCGIDYPEEEVHYLESLSGPAGALYPLPSGVTPSPSGAAVGCPRGDGGAVRLVGPYNHFMKCYSRGEVNVWAPPGTTVQHDAYFWKAPTFVSRAHKDQVARKLGEWNKTGGGVQFGNLNRQIEQMGRLPITTARNYGVGLNRQIVAPWAAAGQTVAAVRTAWGTKFGLLPGDVAYVQRGPSLPAPVQSEASFILALNDLLQWYRRDEDGTLSMIGIPISACAPTVASLLADPTVVNDDPIPVRSDFGSGVPEERRYQVALKKWLIACVTGTIQNFSSSPIGSQNLWAETLQAAGLDPTMAKPLDPAGPTTLELDERVLDPYGQRPGGGLKMITAREMKRVRNRILPMLAYDMTTPTYTAGGDFTDKAQAGHTDRFRETRKPLAFPAYGTIQPQVLAANTNGREASVEWSLGDLENTKARHFYPTGMTWWRLNQKVGFIKRSGGNSYMHLDQPDPNAYNLFALPYTGDDVISQALFFIHGRMPMHMEILRAVLIYQPDDAPEDEAIGCQGQFTGNVSVPSFYDGGFMDQAGEYRGHLDCFWVHYHGYTTNHEADNPTPYYGVLARNHVLLGHNDPSYFLNRNTMNNPSVPWLLTDDESGEVEEQATTSDMEYRPFVAGGTASLYTPHVNIMGSTYEDVAHGFDVPDQGFFEPWTFGQDLAQSRTEHEIWKDIDYAEYQRLWERYHVNGRASVNGIEAVQTFDYVASYFRDYIWPREQSAIPGWINMAGYDTAGLFSKFVKQEPKQVDNDWAQGPQVVVQAGFSNGASNGIPGTGGTPGGGNGTEQAGSAEKVIDITTMFKKVYNDRVERYFNVGLGASYDTLYDVVRGKTDTNLGKHPAFHTGVDDPWYFWNYRFMFDASGVRGMWLNDPWHHPPLVGDEVLSATGDGDPITQAAADREGRVQQVSDWDKQSLTDPNNADYKKYHPFQLCAAQNPEPFPQTLPPYANNFTFDRPSPGTAAGYWRVLDDQPFTHYFVTDLRQTQYENYRRNWRDKPPAVDSSNATCPNTACFVHQRGWTVGQLLENSTASWGGYGVIPSTSSEYCANCHTLLQGVIFVAGDGITTVGYDPAFLPDALITGVEVSSETADIYPGRHHGFTVDYFNSVTGQWQPLFGVEYDNLASTWRWLEWENGAWASKSGPTLPAIFKGCEGAGGKPKNTAIAGVHFVSTTASKLRYRVAQPIVAPRLDPDPAFGTCTPVPNSQKITVPSLIQPAARYPGRTITLKRVIGGQEETRTLTIMAAEGTTLSLSGPFDPSFTSYQIDWKEYCTRCVKFRVYGYPFTAKDLVITPPGFVQPVPLTTAGVTAFRLNNWPSQIFQVTMTAGESEPVQMSEATSADPSTFYFTVANNSFDGVTYKRITAGKWYYDSTNNTVSIPTQYRDPDDSNKLKNIWELNQDLYNDAENFFNLKTLPNMVWVEFFVGNGMPVDVTVQSCGEGPSYQLEPESVCFIANEGPGAGAAVPAGFSSDPMPSMGLSVPLKTKNGERVPLYWQVYNHGPLVWDNTDNKNVRFLVGDELGPRQWGYDDIFSVMTGGLGDAVHQIGLNPAGTQAALKGKVTGTCTLYGSPNTILSGNLVVYAKAITKRTYQTPAGPVTVAERTGGYRCGGFTFKVDTADSVDSRRTGVTCAVPRVLVFARERNLDSDPVAL